MRMLRLSAVLLLSIMVLAPFRLPAEDTPTAADTAKKRLEMLKAQPVDADTVFSGKTFPEITLINPDLVEAAVGHVDQHVRFFDAHWNEVKAPSAPGRYGALIEFTAPGGLKWTQRLTLFKTAQPYFWPSDLYNVTLQFPAAGSESPADLVTQEQWNVHRGAEHLLGSAEGGQDRLARMLAGLDDIAADPARCRGFSYYYLDCAWWASLAATLAKTRTTATSAIPHRTTIRTLRKRGPSSSTCTAPTSAGTISRASGNIVRCPGSTRATHSP